MTFDYSTLAALCPLESERDVACPLCGPDRRTAHNRRREVLRVWHMKPGFATYNCKRCGAHGWARGDGAGRVRQLSVVNLNHADCGYGEYGRRLWNESLDAEGTLVERYIHLRGGLTHTPTVRFHPRVIVSRGSGLRLPAMLAAISGEDHRVISVQVTGLNPRTGTKAEIDPPRKTFGLMFNGSVRLGPAGDELALAEGVETALSFTKLTGLTCWAVLGKARFDKITIPQGVRRLHLGADADEDSRLQCRRARCHYRNIGLDVLVHIPESGGDFNDMLVGRHRRTA